MHRYSSIDIMRPPHSGREKMDISPQDCSLNELLSD